MKRVLPLLAIAAVVSVACETSGAANRQIVRGGDPVAGKSAIVRYGCGSCHDVPGVRGADALVGPPLLHWSRRGFIAGKLPNTPDNLQAWIRDPQAVWPGNDMPDLHVSAVDARNIAAYLDEIR